MERLLQASADGKEIGVWNHVNYVLAHRSGVTVANFGSYLSRWYDEDAILSGFMCCFYVYETRRKVHCVLIFDRWKTQDNSKNKAFEFKFPKLLIL